MSLLATVMVAALIATIGPVPAAWGQSRDEKRQRQREVDAALELATASDDAVEAELARLGQEVAVQRARADDARRDESAAQVKVRDATDKLAAIEGRMQDLRRRLADQAIQAYTDPAGQGGLSAIARSRTLDDASRRQAFLGLIRTNTNSVVEGLRGTREDQEVAARQLEAARKTAAERAAVEVSRTKTLVATQSTQEATHAELQARINHLQEESDALAAEEAALQNLIRTRSAPAAAPTPAAGAAPSAGPAEPGESAPSGPPSSAGLIWPVGGPVTSEFGPRWGRLHAGIDIADPNGTPIAASAGGVVVISGVQGGYGNLVVVDHGNGIATAYAHQSRIAAGEGQSVSQGEIIGYVGSTGNSTGNHLHFEVRVNGVAQNPRNYL